MVQISCVVPCFNEKKRIGNVLKVVSNHPLIDEVIVVDDGSNDKTELVVRNFPGVKLIIHPQNLGKSRAIVTGIRAARGKYILMIDADLIALTRENITALLIPVLNRSADWSISLRKHPWGWRLLGVEATSGERVFLKSEIVNYLSEIEELPGFGLEVFLNELFVRNNFRIGVVPWYNVENSYRMDKFGFLSGLKMEMVMWQDILKTISMADLARQIIKMRQLKVSDNNSETKARLKAMLTDYQKKQQKLFKEFISLFD